MQEHAYMLLHLCKFHVKGDSHPPSQSPTRVETYLHITFVCKKSVRQAGRSFSVK